MVRRGQIWLAFVGVLIAVGGSLFLLWQGDPAVEPDLGVLNEPAAVRSVAPPLSRGPVSSRKQPSRTPAVGREPPIDARPRTPVSPTERSPDAMAAVRRSAVPFPPVTDVMDAIAMLVDSDGTALPGVEVSVQISSPAEVLTAGHVRTDPTGRFSFRAPRRRAVLRVWCQGLRASTRFAWSPDDPVIERRITIRGRAVVGRLMNPGGGAPKWPGVSIRIRLTNANAGAGPTKLSFDRATGQFATLLPQPAVNHDLVVTAAGRVGAVEVARVTGVEKRPTPLLVPVFDPRDRFGHLRLRFDGAVAGDVPRLAVIDGGGRRQQTPLVRWANGVLDAGPLTLGTYQVRLVVGDRVSRWRQIEVRSGQPLSLGAVEVRRSAVLRLQAVGVSAADPRSVRAYDERGGPVRFRYGGADPIAVAIVYPGRYRLELGAGRTRWIELPPGGEQSYTVHAR